MKDPEVGGNMLGARTPRGRARRTKVVRGGPWSRDSAVVVGPKLLGLVFLGFSFRFRVYLGTPVTGTRQVV